MVYFMIFLNNLFIIYKNIIKPDFEEKPDYDLYIILFKNIIRKILIQNNETFRFCFIKEKEINNDHNDNNRVNIHDLFKGFPIKYLIK